MPVVQLTDISYFPGCSLSTSAKENNQSLIEVARHIGLRLVELQDWNCCGSSSAHSVNTELAFHLACRNLSLVPQGRPLLVACPSCIMRLRLAQQHLMTDDAARLAYERRWHRAVDPTLEILHFFDLLEDSRQSAIPRRAALNGIRFAPYYGCMLAQPPALNHIRKYRGLMENLLASFGAEPVPWSGYSQCCGTFLSVARPDVVEPMVNTIMQRAVHSGAECLVTACAMCHLNIEIRCNAEQRLPIFHFSEILSLAYGLRTRKGWFSRHLVDPAPLLKSRRLIA